MSLFKREKPIDMDMDFDFNPYKDLMEMILNFVKKNSENKLNTQFILKNGRSILISHDMNLRQDDSKLPYIHVFNHENVEIAIIEIHSISALGRVPKGKEAL